MSHRTPFGRLIILSIIIVLTVSAIALAASPALAQGDPVVVVNTGALNIRSGPAPNTTSLGSVPGGTELPVTGRNASSSWWRVTSPFGVGWASNEFVAFRGNLDAVPIVNEPVGTIEQVTVFVEGFPATVYRNPNYDSFVVGIVPTGVTLTVAGRSNDGNWWQVQTTMGHGWINMAEVVVRGDATIVPRVGDPGPSFVGPTIRVNTT
ncbi:MAG: SH3 domain-containing protein, partial [Anaerolineae bacterium]|nr:SH3 domain-containing protein [Anaerolineae bacterium]